MQLCWLNFGKKLVQFLLSLYSISQSILGPSLSGTLKFIEFNYFFLLKKEKWHTFLASD